MSRGKRDRLRQRRAAGIPLKVAVVTAPYSSGGGVSLARDVELVKASALYADQVELVSLAAVMLASAVQVAGGDQGLVSLLTGLDDNTLRTLGAQDLPDGWREDLAALLSREAAPHHAHAVAADDLRAVIAEAQAALGQTIEQMLVASGAAELLPRWAAAW